MTSTHDNLIGSAIDEAVAAMDELFAERDLGAQNMHRLQMHGWGKLLAARDQLAAVRDYLGEPTQDRESESSRSKPEPPSPPSAVRCQANGGGSRCQNVAVGEVEFTRARGHAGWQARCEKHTPALRRTRPIGGRDSRNFAALPDG